MKHALVSRCFVLLATGCGSAFGTGELAADGGTEATTTHDDAGADAPTVDVADGGTDANPARCCVHDGVALSCIDEAGVSAFDCSGEHDAGWMHCTLANVGETCDLGSMCWGGFKQDGGGAQGTVSPCP